MSETPTIAQAVRAAVTAGVAGIRKIMPGIVVSYNATTRRASIQPALMDGVINERGERVAEKLPVVNEVPILFPGGRGGMRVVWPLVKGDTVMLAFSDGSLDRWLHKGGVVDPEDDRKHSLSDAFAFPFSNEEDGPAIDFTATEIHAGGTDELALLSELQALRTAIEDAGTGDAIPGAVAALNGGEPFPGTQVLKGG